MKPGETTEQKGHQAQLREEKQAEVKKVFVKPSAKRYALPEVTYGSYIW